MRTICVDDEPLIMELIVSMCRELPRLGEVQGFTDPRKAVAYAADHPVDVALLDMDMAGLSGIETAKLLRAQNPNMAILFLTGYRQYAVDAFEVHASGYLLKPVSRDRLAAEVAYALDRVAQDRSEPHVRVRTFGEFDILVDGTPVVFPRAKAKELLAYLVDRQGAAVTRAEVFSALWEEGNYDRSKQKYLDVIIRSLRDTLSRFGVEDILQMQSGNLRVCPEKLDCDLYRFLAGEAATKNAYRGEYMSAYAWAALTEAELTQSK